jgi:hypothetical protein
MTVIRKVFSYCYVIPFEVLSQFKNKTCDSVLSFYRTGISACRLYSLSEEGSSFRNGMNEN